MTDGLFRKLRAGALVASVSAVGLAACGDSVGPEVDWETIEGVTFDPALGIELHAMYVTGSGAYVEDRVAGTGEPAVFGSTPFIRVQNWLADGTFIAADTFGFLMGNNRVLAGLEDGLVNQKTGGTRLMIIPPTRGYAGQAQYDEEGNVVLTTGSVLVFEVTVAAVQ